MENGNREGRKQQPRQHRKGKDWLMLLPEIAIDIETVSNTTAQ
jgi:hypothetical protein